MKLSTADLYWQGKENVIDKFSEDCLAIDFQTVSCLLDDQCKGDKVRKEQV